jgi:hypothetical protein
MIAVHPTVLTEGPALSAALLVLKLWDRGPVPHSPEEEALGQSSPMVMMWSKHRWMQRWQQGTSRCWRSGRLVRWW